MSKRLVLIVFTGLLLGYVAFAQDGPVYDPENFVIPYIMKAPEEITVDGDLSEWGFAFPIVFNTATIPDSSRCRAWFPADDEDLSGTLYMMYDDEYFYFAANVRDDAPAHLSDAAWAADAIEFYLSDVDIGDALHGDHEGFLNTADAMELQFTITFGRNSSGNPDSITVIEWYALGKNPWFSGTGGEAVSGANHVKFVLWEDEDGYTVEGKICLDSLKNSAGRKFSFTPGTRIATTWSLFDIDETESSADFHGYQYSKNPPWQGPKNWQCAEVMDVAPGFDWEDQADFNFIEPYIKYADDPVTIDCDLGEWAYAFPVVFDTTTIPDSSRCRAWFPADDEDLSGTLYMMYDDEYFYFAANVRDDAPAHLSDAAWAADAIEFYLSDVDIGDALHGDHEGFLNTADAMELQFTITFGRNSSGNPDSITVIEWYALGKNPWFSGTGGEAVSGANHVKFVLWEDEDGYTVEGKICLDSLKNSAGRKFSFTPGTRIATTWSLFDIDETESSADFHGYQYTCVPGAPWQGPLYWQYVDVLGISVMEYEDYKVGIDVFDEDYVNTFKLFPNFPNPFNPTTVISYELDRPMNISMKVYNLKGELVKTVFENRPQEAGRHYYTLYMGDMPSGIYLCVIDNGRSRLIRKMTLVK